MTLIIGRAIDTAGSGDFLQQSPRSKGVSVGGHDAHSLADLYSGDFSGDLNRPERTDSSAEPVSFEDFPVRIESPEVGDILTVGIHKRQYGKVAPVAVDGFLGYMENRTRQIGRVCGSDTDFRRGHIAVFGIECVCSRDVCRKSRRFQNLLPVRGNEPDDGRGCHILQSGIFDNGKFGNRTAVGQN